MSSFSAGSVLVIAVALSVGSALQVATGHGQLQHQMLCLAVIEEFLLASSFLLSVFPTGNS